MICFKIIRVLFLLICSWQYTFSQQLALPSKRQMDWHNLSYYAFTHFGPNTFTDLEWGKGTEPETVFNPTALDCEQWVKTFKDAGMQGVIITAKHHDGFCLWPSKYSKHTVRESKWKNGKGDVLLELSNACKKYGLKFGVYLSPWDRNHPDYGTTKYNQIFANMLTEVLTDYGPVFEVWFDGANGEGPNGKKQVYDFKLFNDTVRKLQPNAVIFSDVGPDIRWVGNEKGEAGETNWATINNKDWYPGKPGIEKALNSGDIDGEVYQPTEVDVSIRPGWFYHENENDKVKNANQLLNIYLNSVGKNANLLLNVPPDRQGRIHKNDSLALINFKTKRDEFFGNPIELTVENITSSAPSVDNSKALIDRNNKTYIIANSDERALVIEINFAKREAIKGIMLREYLPKGQNVISFEVDAFDGKNTFRLAKGTTIGNRRIFKWPPFPFSQYKIKILESIERPALSEIELYH